MKKILISFLILSIVLAVLPISTKAEGDNYLSLFDANGTEWGGITDDEITTVTIYIAQNRWNVSYPYDGTTLYSLAIPSVLYPTSEINESESIKVTGIEPAFYYLPEIGNNASARFELTIPETVTHIDPRIISGLSSDSSTPNYPATFKYLGQIENFPISALANSRKACVDYGDGITYGWCDGTDTNYIYWKKSADGKTLTLDAADPSKPMAFPNVDKYYDNAFWSGVEALKIGRGFSSLNKLHPPENLNMTIFFDGTPQEWASLSQANTSLSQYPVHFSRYQVKFHNQNPGDLISGVSEDLITALIDRKLTQPADPTASDHRTTGWYTDPNCSAESKWDFL